MSKSAVDKFRSLYEIHAKELEAFACRRVGRDEARDIVHEAYLRLIVYAGAAAIENPRAYLYRITANVANDYGATMRMRGMHTEPGIEPDAFDSTLPGPESLALSREMLRQCLAALSELPEAYRHVFLLHRIDGMPQAEIAAALGIPKRTVERYIAKALAHCLARVQG